MNGSPRHAIAVSLALALLPFGCSEDAGERQAASGLEWTVGSEPTALIGTLDADEDASLYQVQDAARLSDGRIAVADGGLGRSRVSVFSPEGQHLGGFGRTGDGPGEFRWVTSLQAGPDDSVFAFDASLQRLTVFSQSGQLSRTVDFRIPVGTVVLERTEAGRSGGDARGRCAGDRGGHNG